MPLLSFDDRESEIAARVGVYRSVGIVSWTKLQPSLVYDIAPQWSVQIGGFITIAGINAGRELGPTAGVWYRF